MAAVPYILAKTLKDAHTFARDGLGLVRGQYRVVTSPDSMSNRGRSDLHLVPGWEKRHDRFALKGKLRYTKMNVIEHTEQAEAPAPAAPAPDDLSPSGFTPPLFPVDDASAFFDDKAPEATPEPEVAVVAPEEPVDTLEVAPDRIDLLQEMSDEAAPAEEAPALDVVPAPKPEPTPEPEPAPAPAEPAVKRRRRKCKDCGELHFKDDPCASAE